MDEYISRKETAKAFCEKCRGYYDGHCIHRGECDVDVIQTAPAADVQLVKHGKWEMNSDYPDRLICNQCNSTYDVYFCERDSMHYCPNCGSKNRMDGDSE